MTALNLPTLTPEQAAAVQQFAESHGDGWQAKLSTALETGDYGPKTGFLGMMLLGQVAQAVKRAARKSGHKLVILALLAIAASAAAEVLQAVGSMQVNREGQTMIIRVPMHAPKPSGSGKHLTLASDRTVVMIDGQPVTVQVNAYTNAQ